MVTLGLPAYGSSPESVRSLRELVKRADQSDPATTFAIRVSVALVFFITGFDKFLSPPEWDQVFKLIGWGNWFRYFTGIVEMTGGLMFLLPATTTIGAVLLT